MRRRASMLLFATCLALAARAPGATGVPAAGGDFMLARQSISGGGGTAAGDGFALTGSVGEPAPGAMGGGQFTLGGGFQGAPGQPCPADTNGDGEVDVNDLVTVIVEWRCASPPGLCAGDTNGDGIVDVDDLVAVIVAWGRCP